MPGVATGSGYLMAERTRLRQSRCLILATTEGIENASRIEPMINQSTTP
jgi:hypothetical protein